ncbi:MAG: FHA domain-containing protein [Myxococcota bacterium]
MDKAELLATFTERLNQYEKYQAFIQKAREQAGKFASAVVDKVVRDNTQKCADIVEQMSPLSADLESVIDELRQNREAALDSAKESQFRLEELELRLAIGDLSDADFRAEASDYKAVVQSTDARVADLDQERMRFTEALERWGRLGIDGMESSGLRSAEVESDRGARSSDLRADTGRGNGVHHRSPEPPPRSSGRTAPPMAMESSSSGGLRTAAAPSHHHHEVLEADDDEMQEELEADDAMDAIAGDDDLVFDDQPAGGNDGFEVDGIDLMGDDEDDLPVDDVGEKDDKPRRAVLLYQEGTAEEQIYPFTGEVMSLGRGRDNDVQVKNDSKVSRYHCKLYRRGPNFYIEDNKSANGTLVNGELITERRLFGGEEVIIGETFFRFRILD